MAKFKSMENICQYCRSNEGAEGLMALRVGKKSYDKLLLHKVCRRKLSTFEIFPMFKVD